MFTIPSRLFWIIIFTSIIFSPAFSQKSRTSIRKTHGAINKASADASLNDKSQQAVSKQRLVEISTDYGVMVAELYDSTPLHRDNFIKLVEQKFYDSLLFHRIINQFIIQGGDPSSKNAPDSVHLGGGAAPGERIPAEFKPYFFHKKGALAAARDENPERASSNCQFYIVQGKTISPEDLDRIYNARVKPSNPAFNYTKSQTEIYNRVGGTPFLDQNYTVFGEVVSGLDVIDKIASLPKDEADRPVKNVRMRIRMLN